MSSSSQVPDSWISSFCSLTGHEYFAEVSEDFIEDDFNLTGLQSQVMMYKEALEMILDVEPEEEEEDEEDEEEDEEDDILGEDRPNGYRRAGDRRHLRIASDLSMIESSAELLYGLIHQRYICSRPGIQQMAEKFDLQHFGSCPRVYCNGAKVLPVGCSDIPGEDTVKLYCPSCLDIYTPPNSRFQTVDGAFFGTTFPTLFFMTFPELDVRSQRTISINSPVSAVGATNSLTTPSSLANGLISNSATSTQPSNTTSVTVVDNSNASTSTNINTIAIPNQPAVINGVATTNIAPGLGAGNVYEPRIYGFRVSERSKSGPRMQWLRMRPTDMTILDERTRFLAADGDGDIEEDRSLDEDEEYLIEEEEEERHGEGADRDGSYQTGKREKLGRDNEGRIEGGDLDVKMKIDGEENGQSTALRDTRRSTSLPISERRKATPRTRRKEQWDSMHTNGMADVG